MRAVLHNTIGLIVLAGACAAQVGHDIAELNEDARASLRSYLESSAQAPAEYLVKKCLAHQVVLLGETHQVRENCQFLIDALPALYRDAGVRCLGSEFLRFQSTERILEIVTASEYDEAAVVQLHREGPWPTWGFREYMDIVRAVWQLNQTLDPEEQPLSLLGLDSDWSQHELWFGDMDRGASFAMRMKREETMFEALKEGPLARGERTLVHCGFAHSVTNQGVRLGTRLKKEFGESVFQVVLHHRWSGLGPKAADPPTTALFEDLYRAVGGSPLGFDVVGSPFADLKDAQCIYTRYMNPGTYANIAMGYVILIPTDQQSPMTWVPGFIDATIFESALQIAERIGWVEEGRCKSAEELDAALAERFGG